jgi:hypothetical protein
MVLREKRNIYTTLMKNGVLNHFTTHKKFFLSESSDSVWLLRDCQHCCMLQCAESSDNINGPFWRKKYNNQSWVMTCRKDHPSKCPLIGDLPYSYFDKIRTAGKQLLIFDGARPHHDANTVDTIEDAILPFSYLAIARMCYGPWISRFSNLLSHTGIQPW